MTVQLHEAEEEAIIVDLDGTLCNNDHRVHFLQQEKKDWDSFFREMRSDKVNRWCSRIVELMSETTHIIVITGRTEEYFTETFAWLQEHHIPVLGKNILMRKKGDFRPDYIVKEELYLKYVKEKYAVLFCLEDQSTVTNMWRKNGLVCLQCRGDHDSERTKGSTL